MIKIKDLLRDKNIGEMSQTSVRSKASNQHLLSCIRNH